MAVIEFPTNDPRREIDRAAPLLDGLAQAASGCGQRATWEVCESDDGIVSVVITTPGGLFICIEQTEDGGWAFFHTCDTDYCRFPTIEQAITAALAWVMSGREAA